MFKNQNRRSKIALCFLISLTLLCFFSFNTLASSIGFAKIINPGDVPTKPSNLSVNVQDVVNGGKYFSLKWEPSTDQCSGVKEYKIFRNEGLLATTIGTSFCDYKVDNLSQYRYKVFAFDNHNHFSPPAQSNIVTLERDPLKRIINVHTKEIKYFYPATKDLNDTTELRKVIHVGNNTISYEPIKVAKKLSLNLAGLASNCKLNFALPATLKDVFKNPFN